MMIIQRNNDSKSLVTLMKLRSPEKQIDTIVRVQPIRGTIACVETTMCRLKEQSGVTSVNHEPINNQ